jgi:aspartyl-tRNA(Asn)/glutamyl-tRNA(Gln) amidotransferase subunit C
MNINIETLKKIAHLSRLELDEKNTDKMLQDMNNMLAFVEKLNEVNTDGIEPLTTMSHEINALRDDVVTQDLTHEQVLQNAPKKDSDYFRVPKVLE